MFEDPKTVSTVPIAAEDLVDPDVAARVAAVVVNDLLTYGKSCVFLNEDGNVAMAHPKSIEPISQRDYIQQLLRSGMGKEEIESHLSSDSE